MPFSRRVFLLASAAALLAPGSAFAQRYHRSRNRYRALAAMLRRQRAAIIKAAKNQYSHGEELLSAANASGSKAQAELDRVLNKMRSANSELKTALAKEVDLRKEMTELEAEILADEPKNSPYAVAAAKLQDTQNRMHAIETKLLGSTSYLAQKATLAKTPGDGGPELVARFRQETLEADHEYVELHQRLADLAAEVNKLKREILADNDGWESAHKELVTTRKDGRASDATIWLTANEKADPLRDIRNAKQAAAAAQRIMADARSVLKAHNASPTTKKTSSAGK